MKDYKEDDDGKATPFLQKILKTKEESEKLVQSFLQWTYFLLHIKVKVVVRIPSVKLLYVYLAYNAFRVDHFHWSLHMILRIVAFFNIPSTNPL